MDAQLKRGLLEACVLAVLSKGDSYGYRIIKDLSGYMEISESTLYPILRRLESGEQLTVYNIEHEGRLRRYYKITPLGRKKIKDFLYEWKEVMTVYQFISQQEEDNNE